MNSYQSILVLAASVGTTIAASAAISVQADFPAADTSVSNNAQLSGLTATYGSFGASDVGLSAWEKFSTSTFTGLTAQYWDGGIGLSATLSQSDTDAGLSDEASGTSNTGKITAGGTDYYGRLTNGGYDFTIDGTATSVITGITLQIKHTPFFTADWNIGIPFSAVLDYEAMSVASNTPVQGPNLGNFSDAIGMSMNNAYYEYSWTGLNIGAGTSFSIDFSSLPDQTGFGFSVDTIALQATSAVPEPSSMAFLFGFASLGMILTRRKR